MIPIGSMSKIDAQSCFTVPRHAFIIGFNMAISKPWILA